MCHTRTEKDEDGRDAGKGQQHTRRRGRVVVGGRSNERVACLSSSDTGTCVHVVSCCVCIASRLRLVTRGISWMFMLLTLFLSISLFNIYDDFNID